MAEQLKLTYDLLVLKVELLDRAGPMPASPGVRFTLQGKVKGVLSTLADLSEEGAVTGLADDPQAQRQAAPETGLSDSFLHQLAAAVSHFGNGQRPLWVHLVKPYGALRLVPWERLLVPAVQVPVLMLPDFIFPQPREATASLEVALCGSAPLGYEEHSVRHALLVAVDAILSGSPRRTRVQVFADANLASELRVIWKAQIANKTVVLHNTQDAAPFVQEDMGSRLLDQAGVLRSPWLLWMRQALRQRAVDVVHFCCHGRLTRGRGALLFAQSPLDRSDHYLAGPVGMTELQTFLTQVGAWSSAFSSPQDNHSEAGLRALADETAQNRPGPMLMHNLMIDTSGQDLALAYGFIYAAQPLPPPRSPALFLYCQPYLTNAPAATVAAAAAPKRRGRSVDGPASAGPAVTAASTTANPRQRGSSSALPERARNTMQTRQADAAAMPSALDQMFTGQDNASPWVATTERFADSVQLRYQELARDELLPQALCQQQASVANDTLAQLRSAVAKLAQGRGTA